MALCDIEIILSNCEILENINALGNSNFRKQNYEMIFKGQLIIDEKNKIPILICVPEKWNQDLIDIYVENYSEMQFLPHIDSDGKLCLFEIEGVLIDQNLPGILIQSLFRAKDILEKGLLGLNKEDFINEFELYWKQLPECRAAKLVVPASESCQLLKCTFKSVPQRKKEKQSEYLRRLHSSTVYIGKDSEELKQWELGKTNIINAAYFIVSPNDNFFPPDIRKAISIEYFNGLLKHVSSNDISKILPKLSKYKIVIFAIKQPEGRLNFAGFFIEGGQLQKSNDIYFYKNVDRLQPLSVSRCDREYLMQRTTEQDIKINKKKILIAGCGSIGGYLIQELVKAGFEDLTIIDDDILSEENIFRHILGMEYVSKYKCVALENYIRKNIPGVSIKSLASKLEDAILDGDICLDDYDLLVSATGNHNINRWINAYVFEQKNKLPIIYAWNEVYGIGSHVAYFQYDNIGCYECLFGRNEKTGELYDKTSYCAPGQKITQNLGGCGKTYVPYGNSVSIKTVLLCLDIIKEFFSNKLEDNLIISVKGDDFYLKERGLKASWRYSHQKENIKRITGSQIANIKCGVCGDNIRF